MEVYLDVSHTFVNDLVITLEQLNTSKKVTLIRNPVTSDTPPLICSGDDIKVTLADSYSSPVNNSCLNNLIPAISGFKRPYMLLVPFNGEQMAGNWELVASDTRAGDSGRLNVWCLEFRYAP
jgi:subtilisin-like proprotein convertase family protein